MPTAQTTMAARPPCALQISRTDSGDSSSEWVQLDHLSTATSPSFHHGAKRGGVHADERSPARDLKRNKSYEDSAADDGSEVAGTTNNSSLAALVQNLRKSHISVKVSKTLNPGNDPRFVGSPYRQICVSWLVEVVTLLGLHQETLFLASTLFDKFLQISEPVPIVHLQLVGLTCLFLAAKMEGDGHQSATEYARLTDNMFDGTTLLRMETHTLNLLQWNVSLPTVYTYLDLLCGEISAPVNTAKAAEFIGELSLLDYSYSVQDPSIIAAASLLLAAQMTQTPEYVDSATLKLQELLGVSPGSLQALMVDLYKLYYHAMAGCNEDSPAFPIKEKHMDAARE